MEATLLTVTQVAEALKMHPKTVRRFIHEGKLHAHRMGGQWRVAKAEVQRFSQGGAAPHAPLVESTESLSGFHADIPDSPKRKVTISSVIDIMVTDREEAVRLSSSLLAVMNSGDPDLRGARLNYLYYESEKRARFVIWGQPIFASKIIQIIAEIARE